MIELAPDRIAAACGATIVTGDRDATDYPARATVDSRQVTPGDLFFGLPGENTDGGEHAPAAIEAGAWGVVVGPAYASQLSGDSRVLVAGDVLLALHGLAREWLVALRAQGCRVVGVTGSTGKTSTKDILLALLDGALDGRVSASRENFNTEIGMPLAVLEVPIGTRAVVLEMAMRGMGQIRELARIARPEVGVITNVGPVHLGLVGTLERVAEAKAELIAGLPPGAACVVPAAEEALYPHLRSDTRVITFAASPGDDDDPLSQVARTAAASADVRATQHEPAGGGATAEIVAGSDRASFRFNFSQPHNLTNALAAIGAAHALGIPLSEMTEGAAKVSFSSLRGEEIELPGQVLLINDTYNANPTSMRAALDNLALAASERNSRRTVAILGDMKELGSDSDTYHREIGAHAARRGVGLLVTVGEFGDAYTEGFAGAGSQYRAADAAEAARLAGELIAPDDIVLVKGSRSVGLERVARELESA